MGFALFTLGAVTLVLLVTGAYVFLVACRRKKEFPWLIKEELEKTPMGEYYDFCAKTDRWLHDHNAKDVYIISHDGLQLHGLWVPASNAKGTVILAHGYRSTYLLDFSAALPYFFDLGMNLLIPDQRAHGKSQGKYITFGVKESTDMTGWIQWHNKNVGNHPILLFGISMGASTMLYMADNDLPANVCGIIADCGFTSPKEIVAEVFHKVVHLPAVPALWVADFLARIFAGFSLYQKDTRTILKNSKLPVLLIHGTGDDFVPSSMSQAGFDACVEPKKLLLVDGAKHGVSFLKDPERYSNAVKQFITEYLH